MVAHKQNALSLLEEEEVDVLTVGEIILRCSGVGLVQLDVHNRPPINVEVLVVDEKLLLRFDAIKKLGGICMTSNGTVNFPQLDQPLRAAITINKPGIYTEYDQNWRIWVVSRKWSNNQLPATLKNR